MFSLEESSPSSPRLCPAGVLAQTLAGYIPLDDHLLGISNLSHCWSLPTHTPAPCLSGNTGHAMLAPSYFACLDLHTLSPDPVDIQLCLPDSTPYLPCYHPNGKIKFLLVVSQAAANGGMLGCVLRNNSWRRQQKPSSCYGVLTDELNSSF